jgi:hypothetical protein
MHAALPLQLPERHLQWSSPAVHASLVGVGTGVGLSVGGGGGGGIGFV